MTPYAEFDFSGLNESVEMLRDLGGRADDMRPAMQVVKKLLLEGNEDVFVSQGAAIGVSWPELAPGTLARKARTGIPSLLSTLVEEGELQEAATGGKGTRARASRSSASAGVAIYYAVFHMKRRPPVGIPKRTERTSLTLVERYLLRGAL